MNRLAFDHLPPAMQAALDAPSGSSRVADDVEERQSRDRADRVRAFVRCVPDTLRWAASAAPPDFATVLADTAPHALHVLGQRATVLDVDAQCPMLVLAGAAGSGKTVVAISRARQLVDGGRRALFVDALALATAHRQSGFGACVALERAKNFAGVLILDDLGQDLALGPASRVPAIELIRARHDSGRKTIVTTGFSSVDLRRDYDHAFVRRLTEPPRAVVIRLGADAASR